jgi:predicted AlkP superfamily pyrophosphatase or phosphodiesterase
MAIRSAASDMTPGSRWLWPWALAAVLSAACAAPQRASEPCPRELRAEPPGPVRHVVVVSIDGLLPEAYLAPDERGLKVPTLRRFVAEGAHSRGALSVFPSVTYPAHTTIATGVRPARHGIFSNVVFDPMGQNKDAWYWFAEELKATPVWRVAHDAGYRTALVSWPVTVGARASWLVPEIWRARNAEDGKLVRALSTPGLLEAVQASTPDFAAHFTMPYLSDAGGADIAAYLLERERPHLLMLHMSQVDGNQHQYGLWSPEVLAAIENADRQVGRLLAAVERAGIQGETVFLVVSDHGFRAVTREVNPGALLRQAGLIAVDARGNVSSWQAGLRSNTGSAYVYLADPNDAATGATVMKLFRDRMATSGSGIARLLEREQIRALGGDPAAWLALEGEAGVTFGNGLDSYEGPTHYAATHGYDPSLPEMKASLLMLGPGIAPHGLENASLVDVAPTIARWLGLALPEAEGRVLY